MPEHIIVMKKLLSILIGFGLAVPCAPADVAAQPSPNERILHLLNRVTFGPKPGDVEAIKASGIEKYLAQQLQPATIAESPDVVSFVQRNDALRMTPAELFQEYGPPAQKAARQTAMQTTIVYDRRSNNNRSRKDFQQGIVNQVTEAKLLRAIESPRQLQEIMTDFWFNHFNVVDSKGYDRIWIGAYEEEAIRPYAMGKFRDLVEATCHHPAMLFYLDNWQNSAAGAKGAKGKFGGLNENYARELMELHTLGVDGGYTQKDVTELARILTGLGLPTIDGKGFTGEYAAPGYFFDASRHDFGEKRLLGHVIHGSGQSEIEEALTILLKHPSTARHISFQLAQYFVSDTPPKSLVDRLTVTFVRTDGDIKTMLNTLFHSPEFWEASAENSKFKSPLRYVVSTLRASDARPGNYHFVTEFLRGQGMPLYGCLTPDGYKNTKTAWVNPDTLLKRISFATNIAAGRVPEIPPYAIEYRRMGATMGSVFSPQTVKVVMKSPEPLRAALLLGSPEFMKY